MIIFLVFLHMITTLVISSGSSTVGFQWLELWWLIQLGWLELSSWSQHVILCIIHPGWLELLLARIIFHGPKPVRAIEILLYLFQLTTTVGSIMEGFDKLCSADPDTLMTVPPTSSFSFDGFMTLLCDINVTVLMEESNSYSGQKTIMDAVSIGRIQIFRILTAC